MSRSRYFSMSAVVLSGVLAGGASLLYAQDQQPAGTTPVPATISNEKPQKKARTNKRDERVVQSKDTKKELRKEKKDNPLAGIDAKLPDKQLYDKALLALKKGHYDVARLDLQTLLNTYPDTQYQMRAKLAIADTWYREGGSAALAQAESEYKDFITFFPNVPEAAEAQMRVGDIYFKQMDRPDRDYSKAIHAQEEYRTMIQQFPESSLIPQAKQRLREVQEVLATREADIGSFYQSRQNWPATIARYQTVIDAYPLYSHIEDMLIGVGDSYEAEARFVRTLKQMPEAAKAQLEKTYDDLAIAAYTEVVLNHSASAHVEDARDRLAAMNAPIPVPTAEQLAASKALEDSRGQYTMKDRVRVLLMHRADTVTTAGIGDPTLVDPKTTVAPMILTKIKNDFAAALTPGRPTSAAAPAAVPEDAPAAAPTVAPSNAPLQLQEVPAAGNDTNTSGATTMTPTTPAGGGGSGNSLGVEIVQPRNSADPGNALHAVGPANATPLPAVEKPAAAPDAVNDVAPGAAPAAQATVPGSKKNPKVDYDKKDESSSKHKKKKGLGKLNPL